MAETIPASYRTESTTIVDEFIDVTLTVQQASALRILLRHAGGGGKVALALRPVFVGLDAQEEHLPDISYTAMHTTAKDGRPLVGFEDVDAGPTGGGPA